ncbi:MAG: transporter substrate-binding domain-containing protein [Desulfobacterales bacterium]
MNRQNTQHIIALMATILIVGLAFQGRLEAQSSNACTVKMGYRTSERLPLIAEKPDDSGLYYDLYAQAAENIGCGFEVVRSTKKRILVGLEKGEIDFYPGFNFTTERAEYTFYMENGLPGGDIGISHLDLPEISDLSQLQGYTLVKALGGPNFLEGIEGATDIKQVDISEMTIEHAIQFLKINRADFFIYNKQSIEYYLKESGITDLKLHPDCCGGIQPLYLGFSRKSPLFSEEPNPDFDSSRALSVDNFPTVLSPDSVAAQFAQALRTMSEQGETEKLYQQYYRQE